MTVPPLSDEDLQLIRDSKNSAQFKVFKRAVEHQYSKEAEALVTCTGSEQLFRHQGILLGLKKALAILSVVQAGEEILGGTSEKPPGPTIVRMPIKIPEVKRPNK